MDGRFGRDQEKERRIGRLYFGLITLVLWSSENRQYNALTKIILTLKTRTSRYMVF